MKFYLSKIELLELKRQVYAVSMSNENSIILLSGFIKEFTRECDINISNELIQLYMDIWKHRQYIYIHPMIMVITTCCSNWN